jgi:hypothetical protein
VDRLDVDAVIAAIEAPETLAAYERDKQYARTAEGGATHFQGKARQTDGPVRYSAPSLLFEAQDGGRMEAGGFQPVEAYDVVIANLDLGLERHPPAESPLQALACFPAGPRHGEVAAIMAPNNVRLTATPPSARWSSCSPKEPCAAGRSATTRCGSRHEAPRLGIACAVSHVAHGHAPRRNPAAAPRRRHRRRRGGGDRRRARARGARRRGLTPGGRRTAREVR